MTIQEIREVEDFLKEQQSIMLSRTSNGGFAHTIINSVFAILLAELRVKTEDEDRRFEEHSTRFDERREIIKEGSEIE